MTGLLIGGEGGEGGAAPKNGKRGKEKVHKRYETKVKDWEKTNLVTTTTTTGENHNHAILWYCGSTEIHVGVDCGLFERLSLVP